MDHLSRFTTLTGLRLVPRRPAIAARDAMICILGVTLWIVVLDAVVLRARLSAEYLAYFTSPLFPRMAAISVLAAIEEVKFRLLLMTLLAGIAVRIRGRLTTGSAIAIMAVAQLANVGHLVLADPVYAIPRYLLVGCVWGWLYWRHGWLAALAGHALTHPLLDPALYFALAAVNRS